FDPEGGRLLSSSGDRTVRLWDAEAGRHLSRFDGHMAPVYQVAFSSDGRRALSAATDGQVVLWDAEAGAALPSHPVPRQTLCAAFAPDGHSIVAGTEQGVCYRLELPRQVRWRLTPRP